MKYLLFLMIMTLTYSCDTLPSLYQAAEEIADDEAISIQVSREAIQKQTDVKVSLDVVNNPQITAPTK